MLDSFLSLTVILTKDITEDTTLNDFVPITIYQWKDLLLLPEAKEYTCYNTLSKEALEDFIDDKTLEFSVNFMNDLFMYS